MLLGGWWVDNWLSEVKVEGFDRGCSLLHSWVDDLVFLVHVLAEISLVFVLMEVEWNWSGWLEAALVLLKFACELLVQTLEVRNLADFILYSSIST